jgi:hypothetical protein
MCYVLKALGEDYMRRRHFITLLAGTAAAWPLSALARQPDPIRRVGILRGAFEGEGIQASNKAFLEGLAQLGWTEGRSLRIDYRSAGSNDPDVIRPPYRRACSRGAGRHFRELQSSGGYTSGIFSEGGNS